MILINVGSNLDSTKGDRFYNIKKTLESMKLEKIIIIKISSVYETPSYPNEKNPKFLNIGLEVQCSHTPKELIKKFNKIEKKLQRVRGAKNQPRTCDIDLIDYDGKILNSKKGDRFFNLKKTLELLKIEKIKIKNISSIYETPSYPNKKNPKFLNIGIEVKCNDTPENLIIKFNKIEKKLQRVRGIKNQPRTCDIDLIDHEGMILKSKKLTIPHPKAHLRNFVLFPIKEISPTWIHPLLNKKIDFLIKKLSFKLRNEITRLKERVTIDQ